MIIMIIAQATTDPYWVSLITGSGGALVVLMMWVRSLSATNKRLEQENRDISRQSVECITKILERQDQEKSSKSEERAFDAAWKKDVMNLINRICDTLKIREKK